MCRAKYAEFKLALSSCGRNLLSGPCLDPSYSYIMQCNSICELSMCVCVCVFVREKQRERERDLVMFIATGYRYLATTIE